MNREQKAQMVDDLRQVFKEAGVVVVLRYKGLSVAQMSDLRNKMRSAGGAVRVAKNRLAKIAIADAPCAEISNLLLEQTAIAYSDDPVSAPKIVSEFSKEHESLVIVGGAMGRVVLDGDGVRALAKMPSLDEIRGKIVGLLQAPATQVARVLPEPAAQLARVVYAYSEKESTQG